jgi:hypothetical protein
MSIESKHKWILRLYIKLRKIINKMWFRGPFLKEYMIQYSVQKRKYKVIEFIIYKS